MSHSEQMNEIAGALAAAQLEMGSAQKNCVNPHFRNKYADINDFLLAVRPHLAKHGISITQMPDIHPTFGTVLDTMLIHKASGQWLKSTLPISSTGKGNAMHELGSALTYLRRFCLAAIAGIASDEDMDDDGNGSGSFQATTPPKQPVAPPVPPVEMITPFQVEQLKQELSTCSKEFVDSVNAWMKNNSIPNYEALNKMNFLNLLQKAIQDNHRTKAQAKEAVQ